MRRRKSSLIHTQQHEHARDYDIEVLLRVCESCVVPDCDIGGADLGFHTGGDCAEKTGYMLKLVQSYVIPRGVFLTKHGLAKTTNPFGT